VVSELNLRALIPEDELVRLVFGGKTGHFAPEDLHPACFFSS
jgi:hypothetical protein